MLQEGNWVDTSLDIYMYQGDMEIGVVDIRGKLTQLRTLGVGHKGDVGASLLMEIDNRIFSPLHDFRGNVVALIDAIEGNVYEYYRYSAYGEEQLFDSSCISQESVICPWRFSSKRVDDETGWVYFGRRYYDAETGKWTTPDPLGFKDSPNVYCYVRNQPMMYIDPDGRMLYPVIMYYILNNHFSDECAAVGRTIGDNYELWANCAISSCMKEYGGNEYHDVGMPHQLYSSKFKVGTEHNDRLWIGYENGVLNSLEESMASAKMISEMANGLEVRGVHSASYGILDPVGCVLGLCRILTPSAKLVQGTWDDGFASGIEHFLQIAHSRGAIEVRNAAETYDSGLREKIHSMSIAPAAYMQKGVVGDAIHYTSSRDVVPWIDWLLGGTQNCAPVVTLTPYLNAPLLDHPVDSPTYRDIMGRDILNFIQKYGSSP